MKGKHGLKSIILAIILAIPFIIGYISWQNKYLEAKNDFLEMCNYIKENEQAFMDFSKYTTSLLDEEHSYIDLDEYDMWNNHKDGKVVHDIKCYISYASIDADGTQCTVYIRNEIGYKIYIIYKHNISLSKADSIKYLKKDEYYIFNNDLYAYFSEDRSGRA